MAEVSFGLDQNCWTIMSTRGDTTPMGCSIVAQASWDADDVVTIVTIAIDRWRRTRVTSISMI